MKINVNRIPEDGEDLTGVEPPTIMELENPDIRFQHEVAYKFHAQIQHNALLVTGKLTTPATLVCGRCLQEFELPLRVAQFVFHLELTGEDFVDLTANIREDIILALPQRALCDEACKGLCLTCGVDLNKRQCKCPAHRGDLHWHALDNLKLK